MTSVIEFVITNQFQILLISESNCVEVNVKNYPIIYKRSSILHKVQLKKMPIRTGLLLLIPFLCLKLSMSVSKAEAAQYSNSFLLQPREMFINSNTKNLEDDPKMRIVMDLYNKATNETQREKMRSQITEYLKNGKNDNSDFDNFVKAVLKEGIDLIPNKIVRSGANVVADSLMDEFLRQINFSRKFPVTQEITYDYLRESKASQILGEFFDNYLTVSGPEEEFWARIIFNRWGHNILDYSNVLAVSYPFLISRNIEILEKVGEEVSVINSQSQIGISSITETQQFSDQLKDQFGHILDNLKELNENVIKNKRIESDTRNSILKIQEAETLLGLSTMLIARQNPKLANDINNIGNSFIKTAIAYNNWVNNTGSALIFAGTAGIAALTVASIINSNSNQKESEVLFEQIQKIKDLLNQVQSQLGLIKSTLDNQSKFMSDMFSILNDKINQIQQKLSVNINISNTLLTEFSQFMDDKKSNDQQGSAESIRNSFNTCFEIHNQMLIDPDEKNRDFINSDKFIKCSSDFESYADKKSSENIWVNSLHTKKPENSEIIKILLTHFSLPIYAKDPFFLNFNVLNTIAHDKYGIDNTGLKGVTIPNFPIWKNNVDNFIHFTLKHYDKFPTNDRLTNLILEKGYILEKFLTNIIGNENLYDSIISEMATASRELQSIYKKIINQNYEEVVNHGRTPLSGFEKMKDCSIIGPIEGNPHNNIKGFDIGELTSPDFGQIEMKPIIQDALIAKKYGALDIKLCYNTRLIDTYYSFRYPNANTDEIWSSEVFSPFKGFGALGFNSSNNPHYKSKVSFDVLGFVEFKNSERRIALFTTNFISQDLLWNKWHDTNNIAEERALINRFLQESLMNPGTDKIVLKNQISILDRKGSGTPIEDTAQKVLKEEFLSLEPKIDESTRKISFIKNLNTISKYNFLTGSENNDSILEVSVAKYLSAWLTLSAFDFVYQYFGNTNKLCSDYLNKISLGNIWFLAAGGKDASVNEKNAETLIKYGKTFYEGSDACFNQLKYIPILSETLGKLEKLRKIQSITYLDTKRSSSLINEEILTKALFTAYENNDLNAIKFSIVNGADVNAKNEYDGQSPLHKSVKNGFTEIVKLLLDKKSNVNAVDYKGYTPLYLAVNYGQKEIIEILLKAPGMDPNIKSDFNYTPLLAAVNNGQKEIVEILLKAHRVDIFARDHTGWRALDLAKFRNNTEIVTMLEKAEQKFFSFFNNNDERVSDFFLSGVSDKFRDKIDGQTLLHKASVKGFDKIVKLLLNKKSNVNAVDYKGYTPLYLAVNYGQKEIVEILLKAPGIDPNIKSDFNYTPLLAAVNNGQKEIVEILLNAHGVDIFAKDLTGNSALDIAKIRKNGEIKELILSKQAL